MRAVGLGDQVGADLVVQQRLGPLLVSSQAIGAGQQRWFTEQRINVNDLSLAYALAIQPQPSPNSGVTFVVDSNTRSAALQSLFGVVAAGGASPTAALFQVTGHWLCAWLAGWLGAMLAATFYRRGQGRSPVAEFARLRGHEQGGPG